MLYTYLDNETQLWCVGCKIWEGGSWGNDKYRTLESGLPSKEIASIETGKYQYNVIKNDHERIL